MYSKKTGKLFEFSFSAPFIINNLSNSKIKFAKDYGLLFGLIFQIIDDLIDETGSLKKIGKTPGKDNKQEKSTLLKIIGRDKVISYCKLRIENIKKKYPSILKQNPILIDMLYFGINRLY